MWSGSQWSETIPECSSCPLGMGVRSSAEKSSSESFKCSYSSDDEDPTPVLGSHVIMAFSHSSRMGLDLSISDLIRFQGISCIIKCIRKILCSNSNNWNMAEGITVSCPLIHRHIADISDRKTVIVPWDSDRLLKPLLSSQYQSIWAVREPVIVFH